MGKVKSSRRPVSVGRLSLSRAPKGVTSTSRDISIHSWSRLSRHCTRTGSASSNRSRCRRDFSSSFVAFLANELIFPRRAWLVFASVGGSRAKDPDFISLYALFGLGEAACFGVK
jgi:hypothetical protein